MTEVDDFIEHFGVKGMKWGRRKAESSSSSTSSSSPKSRMSEDARTASNAKNKMAKSGIDALSNKELQGLVNRMNLEQQYSRLTDQPAKVNAGKKFTQDLIANTAKNAVQEVAKNYAKKGVELAVKAAINYAKTAR